MTPSPRCGVRRAAWLCLLVGALAGCGGADATTRPAEPAAPGGRPRPEERPTPLRLPGVPNAYRVSADLYRGAQPDPEGFRQLAQLGIRTIVNLRSSHSDRHEIEASGVGTDAFYVVEIPMQPFHPDADDVLRFLRVATDSRRTPVFVHCARGADRTGALVAAYRVVVQGWSKPDALREMREGPYGFNEMLFGLPLFIGRLDVAEYRRRLAAPAPSGAG